MGSGVGRETLSWTTPDVIPSPGETGCYAATRHHSTEAYATQVAEQCCCCIVAKANELMAACDRLEAQLATAPSENRRLLEAVLHEALAPTA